MSESDEIKKEILPSTHHHSPENSTADTIITTSSVSSSSVNISCSDDGNRSTLDCNNNTNLANACSNLSFFTNVDRKFIEPQDLKNKIEETIILDCRLLKQYDCKHIKNSVHINCRDKITKKRLLSNKLSVKEIIDCQDANKKLDVKLKLESSFSNLLVVLYDDATSDENDLFSGQNPLQLVLDNVIRTCNKRNCKILRGGFKKFSQLYPDLCEEPKINVYQPINNAYASSVEINSYAIENAKMAKILDYLYLGNECDAQNEEALKKENITHIINVTTHIKCHFKISIKYWEIPVDDALNQNLKQHFDDAIEFIENAKNSGGKVLVHCQAGISRSSTVCIAYLMKTKGYTMNEAHHFIKQKRPIIDPNPFFIAQLHQYEEELEAMRANLPSEPT